MTALRPVQCFGRMYIWIANFKAPVGLMRPDAQRCGIDVIEIGHIWGVIFAYREARRFAEP